LSPFVLKQKNAKEMLTYLK